MTNLDFDLTVTQDANGARRLVLRCELDLGTAGRLEQALEQADGAVVLDLRDLTFMDSTGVRVLLEAAARERSLSVVPPRAGDARVTLEETGIAPLLPLVEEPDGHA